MSSGGPGVQKHSQMRTIGLDHCQLSLHCSPRATIALLKSALQSDLLKDIHHNISSPSLNISMASFALRTQFKVLTFLLLYSHRQSLPSIHSGILPVSQTCQAHSHFRDCASDVPWACNSSLPSDHTLIHFIIRVASQMSPPAFPEPPAKVVP